MGFIILFRVGNAVRSVMAVDWPAALAVYSTYEAALSEVENNPMFKGISCQILEVAI